MITLYHSPMTRLATMVWRLDELGLSYGARRVDWRRADGSGARDPANPHPHGKVPALTDDGPRRGGGSRPEQPSGEPRLFLWRYVLAILS
jgi:glutathione S-transferase